MVNEVINRTEPFACYSIKHTKPSENDLIHRTVHRAQETFQNLFYYLCNGAIACANALKLYKFQKVEKTSFMPTRLQKSAFFVNEASSIMEIMGLQRNLLMGLDFSRKIINFAQLHTGLNSDLKKRFAVAGFMLQGIPILGSIYQVWETSHIVRKSFNSLRLCWNDTKKPLKVRVAVAFAHTGNLLQSISDIFNRVAYEHAIFKLYEGIKNSGFSGFSKFFSNLSCARVDESNFESLPEQESIMSDLLDPKCTHQAAQILNPSFKLEDLNFKKVKKACNKLQLKYHPDKGGSIDLFSRVRSACETLYKHFDYDHFKKRF